MDKIIQYQEKCIDTYIEKVGIPLDYTYFTGKPVKVHIPIETAVNQIMIVGAYPSAYFKSCKGPDGKVIRDVPFDDHESPFSNETYIAGKTTKRIKSGAELEENYLEPLKISRQECWITNLVKVFLFKPGHAKKYAALGYKSPVIPRNAFNKIGALSKKYLLEEISIADPKIIIVLGSETAASIIGISLNAANQLMREPGYHETWIEGKMYKTYFLPHPGIIMKKTDVSKEWSIILKRQIEEIKLELQH